MKYKVGDKVKVRSDLEVGRTYYNKTQEHEHDSFIHSMVEFIGKNVVIKRITGAGKYIIDGSGMNWTDEMFEELAKEEGKLKTWEVVKALTENPEITFVRPSDGVRTMLGDKIRAGKITGKYLKQTDGESVMLSDDWELVPQPVSFMEAVEAKYKGKEIEYRFKDKQGETITHTFKAGRSMLVSDNGWVLDIEALFEGEWFIKA